MASKTRVTVCLDGDAENQKCMLVPQVEWGVFLASIQKKFCLDEIPLTVRNEKGGEIDDVDLIRDDETLFAFSEREKFRNSISDKKRSPRKLPRFSDRKRAKSSSDLKVQLLRPKDPKPKAASSPTTDRKKGQKREFKKRKTKRKTVAVDGQDGDQEQGNGRRRGESFDGILKEEKKKGKKETLSSRTREKKKERGNSDTQETPLKKGLKPRGKKRKTLVEENKSSPYNQNLSLQTTSEAFFPFQSQEEEPSDFFQSVHLSEPWIRSGEKDFDINEIDAERVAISERPNKDSLDILSSVARLERLLSLMKKYLDQENSNEALTAKVVDLVTVVLLEKKELELRLDPTEVTTTKKKTSPDPTYQPIETPKQKDLRNRVWISGSFYCDYESQIESFIKLKKPDYEHRQSLIQELAGMYLSDEIGDDLTTLTVMRSLASLDSIDDSFTTVVCGSNTIVVKTETGKLMMMGGRKLKNSCLNRSAFHHNPNVVPAPVEGDFKNVLLFESGTSHTLLSDNKNHLFSFGYNIDLTTRVQDSQFQSKTLITGQLGHSLGSVDSEIDIVEALPSGIVFKSLACGGAHSCVLVEQPELGSSSPVYSWGSNEQGQLGHDGQSTKSVWLPRCVSALETVDVVQIVCGGEHTLALSRSGSIYGWGCNKFGQSGHSQGPSSSHPILVADLEDKNATQIAAGAQFSGALTRDGRVHTWGSNIHGELGRATKNFSFKPKIVPSIQGVKYLRCGDYRCSVITFDGYLYAWGQLCSKDFVRDTQTPILIDHFYNKKDVWVGDGDCGKTHCVALEDGKLSHSLHFFKKEVKHKFQNLSLLQETLAKVPPHLLSALQMRAYNELLKSQSLELAMLSLSTYEIHLCEKGADHNKGPFDEKSSSHPSEIAEISIQNLSGWKVDVELIAPMPAPFVVDKIQFQLKKTETKSFRFCLRQNTKRQRGEKGIFHIKTYHSRFPELMSLYFIFFEIHSAVREYKNIRSLVQVPGKASVFKVKDVAGGGTFVQKKLSKIGTPDGEHEAMRAEIELMRNLTSLGCGYVVKYVDESEDNESISLYMEYFECSLLDLIRGKRERGKIFSDLRICDYIMQIAQGLNYFHSLSPPMLHRDIKSDNIFVEGEGKERVMKIGDLGECARLSEDVNVLPIAGTPGFIDASILQKQPATLFADVFSLGMVMFELLSLQRPFFDAKNRFEIEKRILQGLRPKFPEDCPGLSDRDPRLMELYLKMTDRGEERPNVKEIAQRLKLIQDDLLNQKQKEKEKI